MALNKGRSINPSQINLAMDSLCITPLLLEASGFCVSKNMPFFFFLFFSADTEYSGSSD